MLIKNKLDYNTIQHLLNKGLVPNQELMSYCARIDNCGISILYMHKKHNLPITIEMLNCLVLQRNNYLGSNTSYITSLGYGQVLSDKIEFKNIYGHYAINFVPLITLLNVIPNEETFTIACEHHIPDLFDYCIFHTMIPTKKHLKLALQKISIDENVKFINKLLCYKIIPDSECLGFIETNPHFPEQSKKVINLLMRFGYKPSNSDVKLFMKYKIHLDNLENLGVKFDDEMYYISHINNDWFYDSKFKLKNEKILGLRQLCRKANTSKEQIQTYMLDNNVKLDRYCLEHALGYNKYLTDWILNELNCEPTITTFYWMSYHHLHSYNTHNLKTYYKMLELHKIDDAYLSTPIH